MELHTIRHLDPDRKQKSYLKLMQGAVHFALGGFIIIAAAAVQAQVPTKPESKKPEPESSVKQTDATKPLDSSQKIVEQGIAIELTIAPHSEKATRIKAGEDTSVKFKVTDTTTGTPVKGLSLSAWMSLRAGDHVTDPKQCREKIQSYLAGSMRARPEVDLNAYYVLALNKSPDISVIDPLLGFGGSKLLALVMLKSPGEDWVLTRDGERLFVTLPLVNQLAVVDTRTWKITNYIDTGINPTRVALQPDQRYLWIANDGDKPETSGLTVIDTVTLKVAAQISTGIGQHQIVISNDNRFAFVSNGKSGTVSIIDVRKLEKINDVNVNPNPVSIARSELSKAVYVATEQDGIIVVIDEQSHKVLGRMKAKPGLNSIRFAPGGRYGFALNTKESTVNIFDVASNRTVHEVKVGKAPDQIVFSSTFAFVRSLGTESVAMIRLQTIGTDVEITEFPGGQAAPEKASRAVQADSIVLAPEGNAVIVANPADKILYYYTEGMAAPMGNFQNYRREPLSVLIVDRSLRETEPGIYAATVKLPASGNYDIAFLADSPRVAHCFTAAADPNPLLKDEAKVALRIEHQTKEAKLLVGQNFPLRFKLVDTVTNKAKSDLTDVRVLAFLAPGIWQRREIAKPLGDGLYEVNLSVPQAGFYMIFVESASMGVRFRDLPYITLQATQEQVGPAVQNSATKP
jgi:DNA-binding beta-propeller fold protein YncE